MSNCQNCNKYLDYIFISCSFFNFNCTYGSGATGQQNGVFESVQCGRASWTAGSRSQHSPARLLHYCCLLPSLLPGFMINKLSSTQLLFSIVRFFPASQINPPPAVGSLIPSAKTVKRQNNLKLLCEKKSNCGCNRWFG